MCSSTASPIPTACARNLLSIDETLIEVPLLGPMTGSGILQSLGHTVGSLIGVLLFVQVVSKRHLGEWYGEDQIRAARNAPVRPGSRLRLGAIVGICLAVGVAWGAPTSTLPVFHIGLTFVLALLLAGVVNRPRPRASAVPAIKKQAHLGQRFDLALETSTLSLRQLRTYSLARVRCVGSAPRDHSTLAL